MVRPCQYVSGRSEQFSMGGGGGGEPSCKASALCLHYLSMFPQMLSEIVNIPGCCRVAWRDYYFGVHILLGSLLPVGGLALRYIS